MFSILWLIMLIYLWENSTKKEKKEKELKKVIEIDRDRARERERARIQKGNKWDEISWSWW